jgi:hypothetical protein
MPSWLALPGLPPMTRRSSKVKLQRVLHLDGPGAGADDAGEAVDLHVAGIDGADAVPVGLLHPAFVGVGVLRAFVDNGSAAQNADAADIEQVEAAEDVCAGSKIDGVARFRVEALAMDAGGMMVTLGPVGGGGGGVPAKRKSMAAWLRKSPGREMESLAGAGKMKADGLGRLACWPDAQPPRLNIDATIPEAGFIGGDGDVDGTESVE